MQFMTLLEFMGAPSSGFLRENQIQTILANCALSDYTYCYYITSSSNPGNTTPNSYFSAKILKMFFSFSGFSEFKY
jgi:hypothetical protein